MKKDVRKRQLNINTFLIQSKQSKSEIIIWAIITFIITFFLSHYLIEPGITNIDDKFGPKPNILSNIVIYKNTNISYSGSFMENFYFLYYLGNNWSTLMFLNASDKAKATEYGNVISPDFMICPNCSIYTFSIKNTGNKKADKVIVDIRTSSIPELEFDNPKMTKKECGGYFESTGCYIVFENIKEGEEVNFGLSTKEYSDVIIPLCIVDGKYLCNVRFIKIGAQNINPKKDVLIMNDKKVNFPTTENYSSNNLFYFDPQNFTFIKIQANIEYLPAKG